MSVGIDKLNVYPCAFALPMERLSAARGTSFAELREVMMIDERSVNAPWEDPVTMAVNAADPLLEGEDRGAIELLIVGSESGVDQEKPMSTWVHRWLGLSPACRNFEVKHACYSATAALRMAASWLETPAGEGKKALVIATDQSRMHLGKPWEFVMGAGAAALLLSREPRSFVLDPRAYGVHTHEVSDLTRPTSTVETGNSETSLLSYLEGLEGAYGAYLDKVGRDLDPRTHFARQIYHAPFGGMTFRAHKAVLRRHGVTDRAAVLDDWRRRCEPALAHVRRMGGTYAASTFVEMLALFERDAALAEGDRVGVFSYGSGSCAELYAGTVGREARALARAAGLGARLDARRRLTVAEYEAIEGERTAHVDQGDFVPRKLGFEDLYRERYQGRGLLVFAGCEAHYRRYARS